MILVKSLDSHDIRTLSLSWLCSQIDLGSQEPALVCDLTVAENIAYGQLSNEFTHEDIVRAAKRAHCHDFIETLPQGYNTSVSCNGIFYLSGGQKQRIAIVRALFRNPKILLLDEATSALDVHNEQLVQESLNMKRQDDLSRTVIIIAHRRSTIRSCDFIYVSDYDGCLLECGIHAGFIALRNAYHRLFLDYVEGRDNS
ncbi:unnamed protein product [Rotaria sordida]|uniref:ABC transporter domain-containing protein n=1 Tax=Rotaria sordida TaxID=392033 RepID=A0A813Q868_9BILA|nr:unnamed protein product [Rotaria sordida]